MSKPPYRINSHARWNYKPVKNEIGADHAKKACKQILKWRGKISPKNVWNTQIADNSPEMIPSAKTENTDWTYWILQTQSDSGRYNLRERGT